MDSTLAGFGAQHLCSAFLANKSLAQLIRHYYFLLNGVQTHIDGLALRETLCLQFHLFTAADELTIAPLGHDELAPAFGANISLSHLVSQFYTTFR